MKWQVHGTVSIGVTVDVEAEDADAAMDAAHEQFSMTNYAGNGGSDQLVGVNNPDIHLDAGYAEPAFEVAEPWGDECKRNG